LIQRPERTSEGAEALIPGSSRRPDLDRALAGSGFIIDQIACASAAQALRRLHVQTDSFVSRRSTSSELLYRLCVSAICHQINWDFLSDRLARAFDQTSVDAHALSSVTARDLQTWLDGYSRPERIRSKERAATLRDIGKVILECYEGDPTGLIRDSKGRLYGPDGFMAHLDRFDAFREDPLRKKSNVLIHEIVRDGVARFCDEAKIAPAIDYHIIRLYLRSGRVVPIHKATLEILKRDSVPRPRLVKLLREAVSEAVSTTSLYAKMSIPQVNGLEWQVGREICDRTKPNCTNVSHQIREIIGSDSECCPNIGFCSAYTDPEWLKLREPELKKSFY
jgi:hypothetical protein